LEQLFEIVGFRPLRYSPYPRVFSLNYWAKRLEGYPAFIHGPVDFISRIGHVGDRLLKVVLHDQIGVVARKIQRLDTVLVDEEKKESPAQAAKVIAVLPAYNAEKTLERTVADIPKDVVQEIILVDDASRDRTVKLAKKLGLTVYEHKENLGYGANQKTCYEKALERDADIVVMVHPDYQYDPKIIPQLIEPIRRREADAVFGSRMMKGGALEGGMPLWKHNANILLTALENVVLGTYLTEYHSGFRAYSARLLKTINYKANSNGFIFDTEIIVQILANYFKIEEVPIRTRYFEEASTIALWPSIRYGLGILRVMFSYFLHAHGIIKNKKLEPVSNPVALH
jgi:glycosyltransferase involved in cell wall biosynthesis